MPEDPDSYIEAALLDLKETLASKNDDYRIDGEFSNFEFAAEAVGLEALDVMLAQIAIKVGRIKGLRNSDWINNESLEDSYKDLAGYAAILYAYSIYVKGDR